MVVFGIFGASVEIWGVLEVLVSYMITRVIKMVVGWVIERVWGFWFLFVGGLGGLEEGGGVYLTPIGRVLPIWKTYTAPHLVPTTT